ncbi:lipopolysaccharide biosynthesis protein [Hoylesella timonensis]|uniref:lipopolysaccharide biosynthesis protein n=1 Tax=Hoylesella timonensis TaxID=386414 RepID=UPI00336A723D
MENQQHNSKRIAKNTAIMYIRMFVMLLIGLYTSRVILQTLGVSDYGTYNVVGGVVAMFGILTSTLSGSISRFITFEVGTGNKERLKDIFSTITLVQLVMSIVIVVLIEVLGVWFLNAKMNIPPDRMDAANFVLQCSILSFVLSMNTAPYHASVVAYERFGLFAYLTILDAVLKLAVVFALFLSPYDKLETYAVLLLLAAILVESIYVLYCRRHFSECRFKLKYDQALLKEIGGFSFWGLLSSASWIINTQGINILINLFFGVTLNAARGIAVQVNSIIEGFVNNLLTTLNPQITKAYAVKDFKYVRSLVLMGAKYSFFLVLFFSLPLCLETEQFLGLWLHDVPDFCVPFVRLTLLSTLVFVLGNTLIIAQAATGHIKKYSIYINSFTFLEFPFTFILYKIGFPPISTYIVHVVIYFFLVFLKIYLIKDFILITYRRYVCDVLYKVFIVSMGSVIIPLIIYFYMDMSVYRLLCVSITSIVSTLLCIYFFGMENNEKNILFSFLRKKVHRISDNY